MYYLSAKMIQAMMIIISGKKPAELKGWWWPVSRWDSNACDLHAGRCTIRISTGQ
jgi:hypothetical protein